jgi:hypothetical protein
MNAREFRLTGPQTRPTYIQLILMQLWDLVHSNRINRSSLSNLVFESDRQAAHQSRVVDKRCSTAAMRSDQAHAENMQMGKKLSPASGFRPAAIPASESRPAVRNPLDYRKSL